MVWWALLLIQVGFQILSGLLTSRPGAKAEEEPQLPTVDATTPIPVPFGRCLIKGAQLIDYFDFRAVPIKVRNPATFFITTITTGYRYYLGMIFGGCWGETVSAIDGCRLIEILIDNRLALTYGLPYNRVTPGYINKPSFFGEENKEGGVVAKFVWYAGIDFFGGSGDPGRQTADPYWEAMRGMKMPNYKDLAYGVWYGPSSGNLPSIHGGKLSGYIGNSTRLWPIAFKVRRVSGYYTGIGNIGEYPGDPAAGQHANPINVIRECLENTKWGASIPEAQIDTVGTFLDAAQTVYLEWFPFSYLWTTSSPVEDMVAECLRYIDGVIWQDLASGKIKIKLARNDYNPATLDVYDNDDLIEILSFTRGSWEDTKNNIRVSFPDHSKIDFENSTAFWMDLANIQIQGLTDPVEITYRGCPNMLMANRLAARDGKVYATPLARLSARVDRKAWSLGPADVFKFSWPEQGIEEMIMRVTSLRLGTLIDDTIEINAVEDIFGIGATTYSEPDGTVWTDPLGGEAENGPAAVSEVPYWMQRDDVPRLFGMAGRPDPTHIDYAGALDHVNELPNSPFTSYGTLAADYPQLSTTDYDTTGFTVENATLPEDIEAGTPAEIAAMGGGLFLVGDPATLNHEWMAAQSVTDNGDGTVTLDNVWRGLLDTPPIMHPAGSPVWFFHTASALFNNTVIAGQEYIFEALSRTGRNQLSTDQATDYEIEIARRAFRPLPPYYVLMGGSYTNEEQNTGDVELTWREHSRLTMTEIVKQSEGTTAPEAGVTWELDIYRFSGELIRSVTGLTDPEYTYTNVDELADLGEITLDTLLTIKVYAKRDGVRSLYPWIRRVFRSDPATFEDGVTVNGIFVTENGVLVTQT